MSKRPCENALENESANIKRGHLQVASFVILLLEEKLYLKIGRKKEVNVIWLDAR